MTSTDTLPENVEELVRLFMVRVDDLAKDMGRRFTTTNQAVARIEVKVEKIDGRIGTIEQARVVEAALATQAKDFLAQQRTDDRQEDADSRDRTMTRSQVWGVIIAAALLAVAALGGIVDVIGHMAGGWH